MSVGSTLISFGEWLPDQPDLGNTGLTVANNVLPEAGYYKPYKPLYPTNPGNFTLPATPRGLFYAADPTGVLVGSYYAASSNRLYMATTTSSTFETRSATLTSGTVFDWVFTQFEDLVFACNHDNTMYHTVKASSNFITSPAPKAGVVGTLGQFVIVGDLREATDRPATIRWCAIGDGTNWPTPNSATATATQAGEQDLRSSFGPVQAIVGGDQYGLAFQERGITRITYAGPPVVFQFDEIEKKRGAHHRHSVVQAGGMTYFLSQDGFCVTDGVSVKPIGEGKVDRTFLTNLRGTAHVRGAYDAQNDVVFWTFGDAATSLSNKGYAYHIGTDRWASFDQSITALDTSIVGSIYGPYAFDTSNILNNWNSSGATIGTALLTTGDVEVNTAGRAFVTGVKPHVESSATAPAITVRVGARNDLGTSPTYTATTTPTTRTGFADCRVDAKYHRAEIQIVGTFDQATGLEFKAGGAGKA